MLADTRSTSSPKCESQDALVDSLVRDEAQVVIWHGQSAADQLTLRRVAYHLRNTPQRMNEAQLSERDLPFVTGSTATSSAADAKTA